jgi:von Willebrand factor type A domain-containing protein
VERSIIGGCVRRSTFLAAATSLGLVAAAATSQAPAIARPGLAKIGAAPADARGVVFFLESALAPGMVAVGTAHTLAPEALARAQRVELVLPGSLAPVAVAERFAVAPGRPFSAEDGTMRDDYAVFLLAAKPRGVRALSADARVQLASGARIRVLGPGAGKRNEEAVAGAVTAATAERIEIQLDAERSLDGWGGAPVLDAESGRVVGILEAALPGEGAPRVLAAPIGGVLDALREPLDGGKGRRFAAFAPAAGDAKSGAAPRRSLIQPTAGKATNLELSIEYPRDGDQVTSTACGTFVAGRAQATRGAPRRFDVVLVIDTSRSTIEAAGTDVNGNGIVGEPRLGGLGSMIGAALTDDGDSILAAEVAAARRVLAGLDPRSTRVGLVAFAGDPPGSGSTRKPAFTVAGLSREYAEIERGLDELLAAGAAGNTHMAAGVDQGVTELMGYRGAYSKADPDAEKVMFFFTDGQPTLPFSPDREADNVRAVLRAATRAQRANVKIHSFAIGPEALEGPIAAVELASRTRGYFTPVRKPGDLVDIVEEVSFADVDKVTLQQEQTRKEALPFRLTADGSWAGFLALEPGVNPIRATAVADEGAQAERRIQVSLVDAPDREVDLPVGLVVQRNRLLEDCLLIARQRRLDQERERNEEIRRALQVEIERERQKAKERADQQRKRLELEGEDEGDAE